MYFGMVHTKASSAYTPHAIHTFFEHTSPAPWDRFFLIINDDKKRETEYGRGIENVFNDKPLSFAENVNWVMNQAKERNADLCFLNNDLLFTPNWLTRVLRAATDKSDCIVSPLSNAQLPLPGFPPQMDLADMEGTIPSPEQYTKMLSLSREAFWIPFFAIFIPYSIYSVVGPMDERFGKAGAEDVDYCLRTWLAGFRCVFANQSWLVHFSGKSTWRGAETPRETMERDLKYREEFAKKWGERMTRVALDRKGDGGITENIKESIIELTRGSDMDWTKEVEA